MRQVAMRFQLVVAMVVAMPAAGRGLPGLVEAIRGPATHVCTCASGGDHASCPVCNGALTERRPSPHAVAEGVPCGDSRTALSAPGDVGTLPAVPGDVAPASVWGRASSPQGITVDDVIPEPTTPPPRHA
jgi:hypothetical protein